MAARASRASTCACRCETTASLISVDTGPEGIAYRDHATIGSASNNTSQSVSFTFIVVDSAAASISSANTSCAIGLLLKVWSSAVSSMGSLLLSTALTTSAEISASHTRSSARLPETARPVASVIKRSASRVRRSGDLLRTRFMADSIDVGAKLYRRQKNTASRRSRRQRVYPPEEEDGR